MIKEIHTMGRYIHVHGGSASTYVTAQVGQGVGNLRFNLSQQQLEVYNGMTWVVLNMSHATVGLNGVAEEAIDWVQQQMAEEKRLEALAKKHPTVADALAAMQLAQEKLQVVTALCDTNTK